MAVGRARQDLRHLASYRAVLGMDGTQRASRPASASWLQGTHARQRHHHGQSPLHRSLRPRLCRVARHHPPHRRGRSPTCGTLASFEHARAPANDLPSGSAVSRDRRVPAIDSLHRHGQREGAHRPLRLAVTARVGRALAGRPHGAACTPSCGADRPTGTTLPGLRSTPYGPPRHRQGQGRVRLGEGRRNAGRPARSPAETRPRPQLHQGRE